MTKEYVFTDEDKETMLKWMEEEKAPTEKVKDFREALKKNPDLRVKVTAIDDDD